MKTLLLHVPKFNNFYAPIGDFIWLNYMPMGLLAIADYCRSSGLTVEVVHLGVEWIENRAFIVTDLLVGRPEIRAVGLTLHWHHQAYDTVQVARRLKAFRKDLFVFAGGDTASFFHQQILQEIPEIDAVVRGSGEQPTRDLLTALAAGRSLDQVPNLSWRKGDAVHINPLSFQANAEFISGLNYTNFKLLRHAPAYVQHAGLPFFHAKNFTKVRNRKQFTLGRPVFPLAIGRGCPFNCTWCAGSQIPQRRHISGLKGFIYRRPGRVVETVRDALAAGYGIMQTAMDPEPHTQHYFIELWDRLRRERIQTDWIFECNGLPGEPFLESFRKTFPGPDSVVALSPECGDESLRMRHKGPGFTNRALFAALDRLERLGITTELFFTYGLPGETERLLKRTAELQRDIRRRYRCVRAIRTLSIEIEPGAPWQTDPESFGIVAQRNTFRDFYEAHSDCNQGTFTSFGYYIPDYFERPLDPANPYADFESRLQQLKCKHFCFIHPNPKKTCRHAWQGRWFCHLASRLLTLKPRDPSRPY